MDWYRQWFGTRYYKLLYGHRDEVDARPWVDMIVQRTGLGKGGRVLDLACGRGRHARCFVDMGLQVTGVDLSAESIEEARRAVPEGTFIVGDIRDRMFTGAFELAVCLFSSLGYSDDRNDDQKVFENAIGSVVDEGWFVLDVMNPAHVLAHLVHSEELEIQGVRFLIEREVSGERLIKRVRVRDGSSSSEHVESVRLLSPERLVELATLAGASSVTLTDGPVADPFDEERSQRCVLWAQRGT